MDLVEAGADDVALLADMWYSLAASMEQHSELNGLAEGVRDGARDGFERHLEREDITIYLVESGGATVGYVLLEASEHPSRELPRYLRIVDLFVEEDHRDQGIGSEAIEAVKGIASDRDVDVLTVSCEWENHGARQLYAEHGFEEKQVKFAQTIE